jgi:hypothetical protein
MLLKLAAPVRLAIGATRLPSGSPAVIPERTMRPSPPLPVSSTRRAGIGAAERQLVAVGDRVEAGDARADDAQREARAVGVAETRATGPALRPASWPTANSRLQGRAASAWLLVSSLSAMVLSGSMTPIRRVLARPGDGAEVEA